MTSQGTYEKFNVEPSNIVFWTMILPVPVTTFMTPGGMPALADNSANFRAVRGLTWAGFMTTVLPAARHAAIFQDSIIRG